MNSAIMGNVVITGVTRGLGRAMTRKFIESGYRVFGCGRSDKEISAMRETYGSGHSFDIVDVTDYASVDKWAKKIIASEGAPDFLVNNAGMMNDNDVLWRIDPEEFSRLVDVNVKGVFHVIRAFVPEMVKKQKGIIVNFSSGWGRFVSPEVAPYCASKWAVEGMTRALAEELPPGMAAVPLNPGVIDTDMLRKCWGDEADKGVKPAAWAEKAVPFILSITPDMNGKPLSVK